MGLQRERELFSHGWHNGERPLFIAFIVMALTSVVLAGVLTWALLPHPATEPIHADSPQPIINMDAAPFAPGDTIIVDAVKCNNNGGDLAVQSSAYWRNSDNGQLIPYRIDSVNVFPPGCTTFHYESSLPADMGEGHWRLIGNDTVIVHGEQYVEPWYTETFEVGGK